MPEQRICLLLLGMHRSGTSALAGSLATLGFRRPKREMLPHITNQKGFFEPSAIVEIHEKFLSGLGSSWDDWRPLPSPWTSTPAYEKVREELEKAVSIDFEGQDTFFVKDPRICRFAEIWLDLAQTLDFRVTSFHIFRNAEEVSASLAVRDGIDDATSQLIWLRHVLDAELATRNTTRAFVSYDDLVHDSYSELYQAFVKTGIDTACLSGAGGTRLDEFLDSTLKHQNCSKRSPSDRRTKWIDQLYAAMFDLRDDPYDKNAMCCFDNCRHAFNAACDAFGPIISSTKGRELEHRIRASKATSTIESALKLCGQATAEVATGNSRLFILHGRLKETTHMVESVKNETKQMAVRLQDQERRSEIANACRIESEENAFRTISLLRASLALQNIKASVDHLNAQIAEEQRAVAAKRIIDLEHALNDREARLIHLESDWSNIVVILKRLSFLLPRSLMRRPS